MKKHFKTIFVSGIILIVSALVGITVYANVSTQADSQFISFFRINKSTANNEVMATVNGEPIYKSSLEFKKQMNEMSRKNAIEQIEQMDLPDEQKSAELEKWQEESYSDDEVLQELIESKVILSQAQKEGITVSKEEAARISKENYLTLKNAAAKEDSNGINYKNYQVITDFMKAMDLTEEEYLDQAADVYRNKMIKEEFVAKHGAEQSDYEKYIDTLVEKSDIEYK